jgi:hypothetical protein
VVYAVSPYFSGNGLFRGINRHKLTLEGYTTEEIDSAEVFRGIIFADFFLLQDIFGYRPLEKVWANPPAALRVRVKVVSMYNIFEKPMEVEPGTFS